MGGRVGLKGTDGVVEKARKLGAEPVSEERTKNFLLALQDMLKTGVIKNLELITCPGPMGLDIVSACGLDFAVIDVDIGETTTATDTKKCIWSLHDAGAEVVVFVGGDGTARDILDAIEEKNLSDLLVLGVPSGVKMYSGIFVVNPRDAAEVIRLMIQGSARATEFEIMDADEEAFREDRFIIQLYGYLKGPSVPARFQGAKQASPETVNEHEAQEAIARYVIEDMKDDGFYILGPGTTTKTVAQLLEMEKTTLGVDIYSKKDVHNDVNENEILDIISDFDRAWIIVSPIGHQGMLFGRGNQQISPKVIEKVGRQHIIVISTPAKLRGIDGGTIKVDTGDPEVDDILRGYIRVITDYNEIRMIKIE